MEHCVVNQTDYKCQKLGSEICISANIVSIIVNIIHIFVIQRITAFSGDVYKKIVLVQSTQDILVAVSHCVTVSCYIQQSIINIDSHGLRLAAAIMKSVFGKGLTTSRYSFFCVALTDRYLAFCKPLQYCGHVVVRHFNKLIALSFICPTAYILSLALIYADSFCIDNLVGYDDGVTVNLFASCLQYGIPLVVLMTPTLFLAVMIIRELRQTASQKKQQPLRRETSDIQRATVYILTSLLAYMLMILPVFPSLVMNNFHPEDSVVLMWAFISFICHPIYGVLNVMIFVGMNKHFYHKCCRKILRKRCNLRQDIEDKGVFNSSNSLTLGR